MKTRGRMWRATGAPGVLRTCRTVKTTSVVRASPSSRHRDIMLTHTGQRSLLMEFWMSLLIVS